MRFSLACDGKRDLQNFCHPERSVTEPKDPLPPEANAGFKFGARR